MATEPEEVNEAFRDIRKGFRKLEKATEQIDRRAEILCGDVSAGNHGAQGRNECEVIVSHNKYNNTKDASLEINSGSLEHEPERTY